MGRSLLLELDYHLNPLSRLGVRRYSAVIPFFSTIFVYTISEILANQVFHNPESVGLYVIFISIALVMYFSFRDAIRGGFVASFTSIGYFLYIIWSRNYEGRRLVTSLETTLILGAVFFLMAFVIGWLKEKIDSSIEREADEKRRLQTIIQQLPVGVLIADKYGRILESNQQVEVLLGKKIPIGYVIGKESIVKVTQGGKEFVPSKSPLLRAINSGKTIVGEEFLIEHDDGKNKYLQISASPIHNKKGQIIAAASIMTDITQQKEMQDLKDEFLGIASHELKTPLTSIKGYAQILERIIEEMGNKKAKQYINKTHRYIDRLSSLIGDLLDVSKLQAGKLEFNYEEYDFDAMIEEAISSFQAFTDQYEIVKKGSSNKKVIGDSSRTEQVVTNLLSNALKYSPGAKKVIVSVKNGNNQVTVGVQDFGIGIARNKQKEIFKRFYRVEESVEKISGLGIGLYISAEIIHRQGGKIWVESREGEGSTFYFSLPIKASKKRT